MTRKRCVKLKMAEGLSRNEANQNAREIVAEGLSYQEDYNADLEAVDVDWDALVRAIDIMGPSIKEFTESIARLTNAFTAGIVAFNKAFMEAP